MNVFLGTFDGVLAAMSAHMDVGQVRSQQGKLRNARLERSLREGGTEWDELSARADFDRWAEQQGPINLCVVAGFGYILKQDFIDRCATVINVHPGLLQQCRGPQPVAAAIQARHDQFGVSVHRIDSEQIDAGPIIEQRALPIDYTRSYQVNYQRIKQLMADLIQDLFSRHGDGEWPAGSAWQPGENSYLQRLPAEQLAALVRAPNLSRWQA